MILTYRIKDDAPPDAEENLRIAIEAYLEPVDGDVTLQLIRDLYNACGSKRSQDQCVEALAPRLGRMPGGPAIYVCIDWPNQSQYFPRWKELYEGICGRLRSLDRIAAAVGLSTKPKRDEIAF